MPHLVSRTENNLIKCDANCPRYNSEEFCGHSIALALKLKCLKSFAYALGKCWNKTTNQLVFQKIKNYIVGGKTPARVRKSLIGSSEKSFLSRSSIIATTAVDTSRYDVYFTSPANVQPMTNFTDRLAPLQNQATFLQDVPPGFPQFTASTPQLVIFNHPLKEIQNEFVITLLSLCDKRVSVCLMHKIPHNHMI